jgi:TatD DNase family protein
VLTETDAPYLAPVPHRGKPNYPHYVREVTRLLATLHGMQEQVMAAQVEANYRRLFRL